ncbi:MAG: helix-turn-helix transcriptional regulator [Actinomycetota bacterium]|nr:helix-turn-helix transcriptional regulator [Actinomycetota bacterium]
MTRRGYEPEVVLRSLVRQQHLGAQMRYLIDAAVRTAQELSWQLSALHRPEQIQRVTEELLLEALKADFCAYNDLHLRRADPLRFDLLPEAPALVERVRRATRPALEDHPASRHYFTPGSSPDPIRLSDLVSRRQLRRTAAYNELLRPMGCEFEVVLPIDRGSVSGVGYALTRSAHDFTDAELTTAYAVQPVLVAVEAALRCRASTAFAETPDVGLTTREREILHLVACGMTAAAIARACRISPATVRKHLEHIYAKLGEHDRLSAVLRARNVGLLP